MTSSQLADRAGLDRAVVSRIERGRRSGRPETLRLLAQALGVSLADLYAAAGYSVPALPTLKPYLRQAYDMPEAALDEAARYLSDLAARYGGPREPLPGEDELP